MCVVCVCVCQVVLERDGTPLLLNAKEIVPLPEVPGHSSRLMICFSLYCYSVPTEIIGKTNN